MATFTPDKPPLVWLPFSGTAHEAAANSFGQSFLQGINEIDVYPVFLEAGHSYQLWMSDNVYAEIWNDFAQRLVYIPENGDFFNSQDWGYLSSLYIQQSGLYYVRVAVGSEQLLDWALSYRGVAQFAPYNVSLFQFDGDHGPNRTPTSLPDSIDGTAGADRINPFDGNDTVRGLDGNDSINGHGGDDDVNGNLGDDTVDGLLGADVVRGGQGNDWVFGGAGDDFHVNGNIGNDNVSGGEGNDIVHGGPDFDLLHGDAGDDRVSGDLGNDTLFGDAGADVFAFGDASGHDTIADFASGQGDRIEILRDVNGSGIVDHASLLAHVSDVTGGARVDLGGGNFFIVSGWARGALGPDLFLFV